MEATKRRVHFLGSGYESVKFVIVNAYTNLEAIEKAIEIYDRMGWSFSYCEIEVED